MTGGRSSSGCGSAKGGHSARLAKTTKGRVPFHRRSPLPDSDRLVTLALKEREGDGAYDTFFL